MASRFEEIRNQRIEKLEKLRGLGINPYPSQSQKDEFNRQVVDNFSKYEGKELTLAGRIMSWREHGKVIFADLQDQSGSIQVVFKQDDVKNTSKEDQTIGFEDLNLLDVGDFIQVTGKVEETRTETKSIMAVSVTLLAKSIRPLPEKWEGLKDSEIRYRRRYLDLVMNPKLREMFIRKAKFWDSLRRFMQDKGFIEVETPVLEHVPGGADAKPFETHHHALDEDFYLRISTELYQKRLIGGGFEKVYTIGPNFRNEGIDDEHLQEYYQLEWYWAYADYRDNMELVKEIFRHSAREVYGTTKFEKGKHTFDLASDWEEIDYVEIIKDRFDVDIFEDSEEKMLGILNDNGVSLQGESNRQRLVDNLWKVIRKDISGPAFLINEPKFMSPLAKSKPDQEEITERFHVIIAGSELGNGYSELNNPFDQLERFMEQQEARDEGDDEAQMLDIDFVEMLEYAMPPTSGYGQSERVFWFLEDVTAREGTIFPQMKRKISSLTRRIYDLKDSITGKIEVKEEDEGEFTISNDIRSRFTGMFYATTMIKGVNVKKKDEDLEEFVEESLKDNKISVDEIESIGAIGAYRKLFKETGAWKLGRRPSPEALLRRISQGKGIYHVNTAVDAYNMAVIETGISLGGFDADKIEFPVTIRFTQKGENMELLGESEETETLEGEIAYADAEKLLTLDLNYRDIDETKITTETENILLFSDGAPGLSESEVVQALEKGASYIQKYCGGEIGEIKVIK